MVSTQTENNAKEESFAALFEESLKHENVKEGDIVKGKVIHVGKDHVVVDIGYKSEGTIPLYEFTQADGGVGIKEGDEIDVFLESREDENGLCVLSKEKADRLKVWDEISGACERDELIEGTISARVKGGLSVTIRGGVKAFLPGSQVDLRPVRNLDAFIGKSHRFKVIKFNKKRGNIVLSRRVLLEKERAELKGMTLEKLKEGQIVEGIVKNLTEYGAFIDLGGIDGLLHITDMSWGRVTHPSELFQVGDHVRVKVLKFNVETERVSLGLKQISEDPWTHAQEKYPPGTVVRGKVVSLKDYGAFIELEEGIEGLVHISEMSWTRRVKHPSKVVAVGDTVEAVVLDIDPRQNRISLGIKQLEPNPFASLKEKYPPGTVVRGKVVSLKDYGAFIELEEGIEGLVHISEMSWTRRVKHPSKVVAVGDTVEAVVLDIDPRQNRISLGIKQLEPNPFASLKEKYPPGTVVKGVIRNIADFGIFVEIEEGIDGLVHVSDLSWTQRVKHPSELYQKGDEVEAVVLNIDFDGEKPKVSLGIKQLVPDPWDRIPYDYPVGKIVEAKVIKVLDFGAFVEIEKGVEGLIHVSEFSEDRVEDAKTFVKPGQTLKAEIIGVDTAERKIGLSFRGATRAEELADAQGFSGGAPTATLGDVMRDKLAALAAQVPGQKKNAAKEAAAESESDDSSK
jgi:small subunit ribosomal protein S1